MQMWALCWDPGELVHAFQVLTLEPPTLPFH